MKPALMFWTALLFLFAGIMTFLFASGYFERRDEPARSDDAAHAEMQLEEFSGEPLVDFDLVDQSGSVFASTSLAGKIWVGSVFFSSCPSTCRVQNMRVAELQQLFGDKGVEFVSITCDPDRDTVSTLAEYSKMFGAKSDQWHFLTGEFGLIKRIGNEKFGIVVERETHSDRLVLFGRDGQQVGSYRSTKPDEFNALKTAIESLLESDDEDPVGPDSDSEDTTSDSGKTNESTGAETAEAIE